jgi:type I restriction enzyme, R subunit
VNNGLARTEQLACTNQEQVPNFISEDQIERALLQRLQHLDGFDVLDCRDAEIHRPEQTAGLHAHPEIPLGER